MGISMKSIRFLAVAALGLAPLMAHAEDSWACEVVLCLANPKGATAVAPCVPPIKKLFKELAKGNPFPTCNMNSGDAQGNSAKNTLLSGKNCPAQHRFYVGKIAMCEYQGVINVKVANKPYTRVYWSEGQTYTEDLGFVPPGDVVPGDESPQPGQIEK
jgi:hypothetical protein